MDIIRVILTSLISLATLFLLTKLMGYRQMSQLSMFDYINGITIGSIAAEMATTDEFLLPFIAMLVYTLAIICFSFISNKSIAFRRFVEGTPLILFNDGKIYKENLKRSRIDISEFLVQCRTNGYFDLADIQVAILECNGKISFLPINTKRPVNPSDLNIIPKYDKLVSNIIMDGNVMLENLKHTGNNEKWLHDELHSQGYTQISDIALATCDCYNTLCVYKKCMDKTTHNTLN